MSGRVLAAAAVGVVLVTAAVVTVLWLTLATGPTDPARVAARLDVLRIGLSIGLGGGGLFALYLAWRRQRSTEIALRQKDRDHADVDRAFVLQQRVAEATERDATARRITELYTKAVEQLGSEKAPVRLGGLYALERLAQDNPSQRQTIVNVLCAYLRMPYQLPDEYDDEKDAVRESQQEREVRLAAQRLLATHLRPGNAHAAETFWPGIDLDLTGATLIDFTVADCAIRTATFDKATFAGTTWFDGVTVTGDARFERAGFAGDARFYGATFTGNARFVRTGFADDAQFVGTEFTGDVLFSGARFAKSAWFDDATFTETVWFNKATFAGHVGLVGTRFALGVPKELAPFDPDDREPSSDIGSATKP
ncbi:MAG TPA: pentapeptide repeat-containing protein [Actinokineospora sp.]|nr:pentapeptide repeat-containing protein [Actinokineospora sp.]